MQSPNSEKLGMVVAVTPSHTSCAQTHTEKLDSGLGSANHASDLGQTCPAGEPNAAHADGPGASKPEYSAFARPADSIRSIWEAIARLVEGGTPAHELDPVHKEIAGRILDEMRYQGFRACDKNAVAKSSRQVKPTAMRDNGGRGGARHKAASADDGNRKHG